MPKGYQEVVGESGVRLSRTKAKNQFSSFYEKRIILIFDEPTSSLE